MNAARHEQVKQIFLAACELEPSRVCDYLDEACAGDAELRQEVESLLAHHQPQTLLRTPVAEAAPTATRPLPPGLLPPGPLPAAEAPCGLGEPAAERFAPGKVLAARYRIVAALGRGGMGDVYRADDLKLGQTVALKFLARGRSTAPSWLRRYRHEVRMARKVAHPNLVQVFDIIEAEGEVFIVMEYVDGEDLASLLRRVGRLTGDKAIQIARELCAGLGAAHDRGVLHCDLKPANIMIDGRGRVRITDFGIAAPAEATEESGGLAGTPGFMAPELFQGARPSVRSDLYSLGLVLYEMVTGRPPCQGGSSGQSAQEASLARPSAVVPEVDPALDAVILACLQRDPKRRPDSAYAVAAALPGGDPLAAALAAGETPSPSTVAAAAPQGAMRPGAALGWLAAGLAALGCVVALADRTFFLPQAGLEKPPAVLADRAEQIMAALGQPVAGQEHWQGFALDRAGLEQAATGEDRQRARDDFRSGRPPAVCFWFRTGGEELALPALLGEPMPTWAFPAQAGMTTVRLDGGGRLLEYLACSDGGGLPDAAPQPADWSAAFALAALPMAEFRPIRPVREPPRYADAVAAWEGCYPDCPQSPVRVEGASLGGRIVYFAVVPAGVRGQDWSDAEEGPSRLPRRAPTTRLVLDLLGIVVGSILAWHNLRLARGDQRGAGRLVCFVLVLGVLDWLLGERHVAGFTEEVALFYLWLARATFTAALAWVCYIAVEPYVRRFWPRIMVTWSRMLGGQFHDPQLGRDLLIGGTCGILLVLVLQLDNVFGVWLGSPPPLPKLPNTLHDLGALLGLRYKLSILVATLLISITLTLTVLLLVLVLRVTVRSRWLAITGAWLLLTSLQASAAGPDVFRPWLIGGILAAVAMLLLARVGLVGLVACSFCFALLVNSPLTADLRAWYAPASTLAVGLTAALLAYAFFIARAGRPLFPRGLLGGWR